MKIRIAHTADWHIRARDRHDEYKRVFENFKKSLIKNEVDVLWIGGDLWHTKLSGISPEFIRLFSGTLKSLSEVVEVHLMCGNHDGNLANSEREDTISPIIDIMNDPRVKLYKTSGIYPLNSSMNWCVYSPFDSEKWPDVVPQGGKYNIACFHGAVSGAKTATGWELDGEKNVADFNGFNIALLGDIHKMQFLGSGKRIAYPGSLVQQDYGEDLEHGYLLWTIDLETYEHDVEFVSVEGANPFITLRVTDQNYQDIIKNELEELKNVRCRLVCEGITEVQKTNLKGVLSSNNVHEVVIVDAESSEKAVKKKIAESVKLDSIESLISQAKNYMENHIATNVQWCDIEISIRNYAEKLKIGNVKPHRWTINNFSFENLYSYSESNNINFSSFSGLVGITGGNASGKSSVLGALLYSLFNSSDRDCSKNAYYINDSKDNAFGKCQIEVDGGQYEILRTSIRSSKDRDASSTKLYLKSLSKNLELTGEQRSDTDKVIRDLIGTVEDFMMTAMAAQEDMGKFLKEGSSSRKEIVSRFLGIDCLTEIHNLAKKDLNSIKSERKILGISSVTVLTEALKKKEEELKSVLFEQESKTILRDALSKDVQIIQTEISKAGASHLTKSEIELEISKVRTLRKSLEEQIPSLESEIFRYQEDCVELEKKIISLDALEILQKLDEALFLKDNLASNNGKLSLANEKLESAKKSSLKLLEVPCKGSFPTCKFILDSHRDKESLTILQENVLLLEKTIDELCSKLNVLRVDELLSLNKQKESFSRSREKLISDIHSKQNLLSTRKDSLLKLDEKISFFINQLSNLDEEKINLLKDKKEKLRNLQKQLDDSHAVCGGLKKEIEIAKKQIETCISLDNKQNLLEVIVNSFSKDGFPKYMMSMHMEHINDRMNELLSKIVDFTVELRIDNDKGNLDVILNKKGKKRIAELGSGMERTLISLALRIALREISCIPMPDFFVVDEGFSMLDADNIMACKNLLNELKKMFRFVIVMTHNDTIKEMMDHILEVSMVGEFSKIDAGKL